MQKKHLSDSNNWDQKEHTEDFILYPKNIGCHLCIDETVLSKGELYRNMALGSLSRLEFQNATAIFITTLNDMFPFVGTHISTSCSACYETKKILFY